LTEAGFPERPGPADLMLGALVAMATEAQARLLQDPDRAAPWVEAAAQAGVPAAQLRHGRWLLERGAAGPALGLFLRAARTGDADAWNMVGRCLQNGWGVAPDARRAARWYLRAARAGHAWGQYNVGHLLLDGVGVSQDLGAAYRWYLRAAEQGHPRAMNLVARCLEQGWGAVPDPAAARGWLRRSAAAGYFRGQFNHATVLVGEGRLEEAALLFAAALEGAPEPTRGRMARMLASRPEPELARLGHAAPREAGACS
jgi:hypothetical protein